MIEQEPGAFLGVVYGGPGTGKTTSGAALIWYAYERTGKSALYVDEEDGYLAFPAALKKGVHFERWTPTLENKSGKIVASDPGDDIYEIAEKASSGDYSLVMHDTITTFASRGMKSIVSKNLTSSAKGSARVHIETAKHRKINHPSMQDYGVVATLLETYLQLMLPVKASGVPVLWLGHDKLITSEDEEGNVLDAVGSVETIGKQMSRNLPKLLAFIVRIQQKRKKGVTSRIWNFEGDGTWISKDRLSVWKAEGSDVAVDHSAFGENQTEEFKEATVEAFLPLWEKWIERYEQRAGIFWRKEKK